jgi:HSP20 family protein
MLTIRRNYPSINLFDSFFQELFEIKPVTSSVETPIYDIIENDNEFQIELLLPGIKKEDININVENDTLTINAERKEINDIKYNRKQTYFGKYERSFVLPENVNSENIQASLNDGILNLVIPKIVVDKKISKKSIEIK